MSINYLRGEKVHLRALEPEDLEFLYEIENDPMMWNISNFTVPYSKYILRQYIINNHFDLYTDKQVRMMIVSYDEQCTVGTIDLTNFDPLAARAEVGVVLHEQYRNNGYAREALQLIKEYAFYFLKLNQLYSFISINNCKSLKLFESTGFEKSGLLEQWVYTGGNYEDVVFMQCLNKK